MDYDINLKEKLGEELIDLWPECSMRCDRIEELLKQINETQKIIIFKVLFSKIPKIF